MYLLELSRHAYAEVIRDENVSGVVFLLQSSLCGEMIHK